MSEENERKAFAERLNQAIKQSSNPRIESASDLALHFNLAHSGGSVTPQAAHQWLTGTTRPTAAKMAILAELLHVPLTWLKFGLPESTASRPSMAESELSAPPSDTEMALLRKLRQLPPSHQKMISDLADLFCTDFQIWQR